MAQGNCFCCFLNCRGGYLYLVLKSNIVAACTKTSEFAAMIDTSFMNTPYTAHKVTELHWSVNMPTEMSLADFVFQTRLSCGNRAIVVKKAASNPIIVIYSMLDQSNGLCTIIFEPFVWCKYKYGKICILNI